ncbi:MAG: hypothetical protein LUE19_02450 [Clostridiales bacterium]|nr:hypothetical protein [Clostridiales bacterium]
MGKKFMRTCRKRFLSVLLAVCVAAGCMTPVVSTQVSASETESEAQMVGGVITNAITKNVSGIVLEYVERGVLLSLGKAADNTDGTVSDILSVTKRLLGSSQSVTLGKISSKCDEILDELDEIKNQISENQARTEEAIAKVDVEIKKEELQDDWKELSDFSGTYQGVLDTFDELTTALQTYADHAASGELTDADEQELRYAYGKVKDFYAASSTDIDTHADMEFNFYTDLMTYLEMLSPYYPTQALPSSGDLTDESLWGDKVNDKEAYVDHLYKYYSSGNASEDEVYEGVAAGINEAITPLTIYLTAYRIYTEYEVQIYLTDATITDETDRDALVYEAWNDYYIAQNRIVRTIEQMLSFCHGYLDNYMRPYDVSQKIHMSYSSSGSHPLYKNFLGSVEYGTLYASYTSAYRMFYIVKPANTDSVYAINQWLGDSSNIYAKTIAYNSGIEMWESTCYVMSQDYYNLFGSSGEDSGFTTISDPSELSDLVSPSAFALSGHYLDVYFTEQLGLQNVAEINHKTLDTDTSALRTGSFLLLAGQTSYSGASMDVELLNISMTLDPLDLDNTQVEISAGDLYQGKYASTGSDPLYVIMRATSISRTISQSVSGGSATLYKKNSDDSLTEVSWGSSVASGTAMELHITPESGKVIDSVTLLNYEGEELCALIESYEDAEEIEAEDDGSYVLHFSSPYQNVTVQVSCIDDPDPSRQVTLTTSDSGDLQFDGYNGISTEEYSEGDTVTFYARAYTGKLLESVTVTAADGSEIDCTALDETPLTLNSQGYTFTMPDQDVTVSASYTNGYTVVFSNPDTGGYALSAEECQYDDWRAATLTYAAGDTVTITTDPDDTFYCSNIIVRGLSLANEISVTVTEDGISFVMPEQNVLVTPVFASSASPYVRLVGNTEENRVLAFSDDGSGNTINSNVYPYAYGTEVTICIVDENLPEDSDEIRLKLEYSTGESFTVYTYDEEEKTITFTMPNSAVLVYAPIYLSGEGTEESPYLIGNYDTLVMAADYINSDPETYGSACYELTADLDAAGESFTAIESFSGTFSGNGYSISGLTVALFGTLEEDAVVSDLILTGSQVAVTDGAEYAGIVADINNGTISGCIVEDSSLTGSSGTVGGGIAGLSSGVIENSAVYGTAFGAAWEIIGGIAGQISGDEAQITDSYASAALPEAQVIYGEKADAADSCLADNCYYDSDLISAQGTAADGTTAKTAAQFASGEVTWLLNGGVTDGTQVWYQNVDVSEYDAYPQLAGATVYYYETSGYSNHVYENGICADCGIWERPNQSGDGTYLIGNAGQLFWFAAMVNGEENTAATLDEQNTAASAMLTADIDLEGMAWTPIGSDETGTYQGVFDGQNYAIENLSVDSDADRQGLFGVLGDGAVIRNLTIESGSVSGANYVGAIAGAVSGGTAAIENCLNRADVTADGVNAGGIVGCVFSVEDGYIAIRNCGNTGTVKGASESAGIAGYAGSNAVIDACYNTGTVTGYQSERIIARYGSGSTLTTLYYLDTLATTQDGGTAASADDFSSGMVTWNLNGGVTDGTQAWYQTLGTDDVPVPDATHATVYYENTYFNEHRYENGFCTDCGCYEPAVKNSDGVYEISNGGQLFWFAALVNGDTTNADFESQDTSASAVLTDTIDLEGREWTPIGLNYSIAYRGTFDGQGNIIRGISITKTGTHLGLFGYSSGAEITDFSAYGSIVLNGDVDCVGGIVAYVLSGTIDHVINHIDITNTDGMIGKSGGIAGCIDTPDNSGTYRICIEKCMNYGTIAINYSAGSIGGIVGFSSGLYCISDCGNVGALSSRNNGTYNMALAGIIGDSYSAYGYTNNVINCFNSGLIAADNTKYTGAILGLDRTQVDIKNCIWQEGSADRGIGYGTNTAIMMTEDSFQNGEVAWQLNTTGETEDNRGVWTQGEEYPVIAESTEVATYCISFQYNNADEQTVRHATYYINGGLKAVLPEIPTLANHRFAGWFTEHEEEITGEFVVSEDITLTGKFVRLSEETTATESSTDSADDADSTDSTSTGSGSAGSTKVSSVRTGDPASQTWLWLAIGIAAAVGVSAGMKKRKIK